MSVIDELLANAERYAERFGKGGLPPETRKKLVVIACMDARVNPYAILGLEEGDAQILRNAGGVVTDDVIRSLAISQRLLGTEAILLMHHTGCGMLGLTDEEFNQQLERETGERPEWPVHAFADVDEDVRESIARIKASPFIARKEEVRGFVYEVETGRLREVTT